MSTKCSTETLLSHSLTCLSTRYYNLDYHWASTLAGLLGATLGAVPFVLIVWGHKIRKQSRLSSELQKINDTLQK